MVLHYLSMMMSNTALIYEVLGAADLRSVAECTGKNVTFPRLAQSTEIEIFTSTDICTPSSVIVSNWVLMIMADLEL